jgi:excisionase family DNA binding protein
MNVDAFLEELVEKLAAKVAARIENRPVSQPSNWLGTEEAAKYLGVTERSLQKWREKNVGPKFSRVGPRLVRYAKLDLDAFVARKRG